jgi:hypothetical protein
VLHPEKYFAGVSRPIRSFRVSRARVQGAGRGSLGELEHGILLEQYTTKERAAELAPHWKGSSFELQENRKAARVVLLYSVEWDTEDAARQFRLVPRDPRQEVEVAAISRRSPTW